MQSIGVETLERITRDIFAAWGVPPADAAGVARQLVLANLRGHDSHGVIRIPQYVAGLKAGHINPTPRVATVIDTPAIAVLDGDRGLGQVVARKGIKLQDADPRKKIKEHCRVRYNKPSMMQHIEHGRRTEIDALNGALVREAKALGIPTPYNEAIVAIVKGLEKSRHQSLHEPPRDYARLEAEAEQGK